MIRLSGSAGAACRIACVPPPGPSGLPPNGGVAGESDKRPETDLIRDYYRVEDSDGARFWIFRAGLHAIDRMPRWYLHGLFA